ncbi:carbohydrate binding family 9 domain-containing protein [Fodinibius sp. Rm-B-1B1-1]|uniref:carbohydrate binding family 9 domain-containing protein n=1 Tax=Fodinibius alkaliphilus TaxID=3140241 RepID=UPI00315B1436
MGKQQLRLTKTLTAIIFLCLSCFHPHILLAQTPTSIPNISNQDLIFDGQLNESFWKELSPINMTMYQPVYQGTMAEENEIYLVYNQDYIYLAANLYYEDLDDIRSNSLYRDEYSGDDTFALILDTFNDNENAQWFFTNPAGTRFDVLISDDAETINFDWDTYWDVKTARTNWGWSVEMRVPFSTLGFQSEDDKTIMGVSIYRYLAKLNERYIYPAVPPTWDNGFRKPSQAQKIVLENIKSDDPIYITPYLLGGLEQNTQLNSSGTAYKATRQWTYEPGVDVKLNLTSNLTMDVTVNTDFAQVEADDEQINLTRFPLFFSEKRRFFQERSSVFNFGFTQNGRLFHSRRIGLSNTGEPVRIYGGIRTVGKLNNTDVGFINMQTAPDAGLPSENFNVIRAKRKIFNRYSTIGGMFTSRISNKNRNNYSYGTDAIIRVIGDEYLTLKLAQTYQEQGFDLLKNSRALIQWQRRRNDGLSYRLDYDRSGNNFNPEVGFTTRNGFSLIQNNIQYKWITDRSPIFQNIYISNFTNAYRRHDDAQIESAVINPQAGTRTKNGSSFDLQTNIRYEHLLRSFQLSDNAIIPAGEYWYQNLSISYGAPDGWKFRPEMNLQHGNFFDGNRTMASISTVWNLSKHFEINNEYEYNKVQFPSRNQRFDAHIARFRLKTALNTKLSLNSFIQYNSEVEKTSINARFRYNIAEGDDLWIVYDNVINTQRQQVNLPTLPLSGYQALLVKFTYSFKL